MSIPEFDNMNTDVVEDRLYSFDQSILRLLLRDKSSRKNIIWATSGYSFMGYGYEEFAEILPEAITGGHTYMIQPRSSKAKEVQEARTKEKAEVFTPSWVCNKQNNLVDDQWFGRTDIFNTEEKNTWKATTEKIVFDGTHRTWEKYVDAQRLEISCGEAPYLVSRYDTVSGNLIPLAERIGFFDRKMRVVSENTATDEEWITWSIRALQSVYGYEYQGDNLLLARENMLMSYMDYYKERFHHMPGHKLLKTVANIITWNLWQMDGMKYVVPNSCHAVEQDQIGLFQEEVSLEPCPGCKYDDPYSHNGIYCKIMDWRSKCSIRFIDMMRGAKS